MSRVRFSTPVQFKAPAANAFLVYLEPKESIVAAIVLPLCTAPPDPLARFEGPATGWTREGKGKEERGK